MTVEYLESQAVCRCPRQCGCGNTTDLLAGDVPYCGCCLADCPDVHSREGIDAGVVGYTVRTVPWRLGWELHVDGLGVTQCTGLADAEDVSRDFLDALDHADAHTAEVRILTSQPRT